MKGCETQVQLGAQLDENSEGRTAMLVRGRLKGVRKCRALVDTAGNVQTSGSTDRTVSGLCYLI